MLDGVEITARQTTALIHDITALMQTTKQRVHGELPKIYSQDLINNLFRHPYTKIEFVMSELNLGRKTAAKYLDGAVDLDLLSKHKIGKENFYLNDALFALLCNVSGQTSPQRE